MIAEYQKEKIDNILYSSIAIIFLTISRLQKFLMVTALNLSFLPFSGLTSERPLRVRGDAFLPAVASERPSFPRCDPTAGL